MTLHDGFIQRVVAGRAGYRLPLQAYRVAEDFATASLGLLFPHFAAARNSAPQDVQDELGGLRRWLDPFLKAQRVQGDSADAVWDRFLTALPQLAAGLEQDARATADYDPAAHGVDEVILAYPGFFALACHRVANLLASLGVDLLPRLVAEYAHRQTGIDIHPGARIGRKLAIDHGTGIVIGETTVIGDRVRIYQGVTLGALNVSKDLAKQKRHPTIEDDVVIYANATILGGETVIGAGTIIGGNVWLTHSVAPGSVVTHGGTVERS
ncbi:MAG TPA: serine O-acetyltransferase, partial [Gemmatimonadales bacterium]|nr:serine O-acetyltransferase [Gemmatimonadales bacterium]